ncbi:MAG TPA: LytS/YhcK type 5TM receptor domain-containing protein [Clostridium sp.]
MIELLRSLTNNLGYVILIAFFVSRIGSFKKIVQKDKFKKRDLLMLSIIFGTFGILGTYTGTDVNGAVANTRIIGVMAGGILCGPYVGILAGVIAGMHRLLIDTGGITSIPCTITTIVSGIVASIIYKRSNENNKWFYGLIGGLIIEVLEMVLILLMAHPFHSALTIVKSIYFPMRFTNAIGIAILILIIRKINMYMVSIGKKHWMATVPATFMTAVCTSYILIAPEGFKLSQSISYPVGIIAAIAATVILIAAKKGQVKSNVHM